MSRNRKKSNQKNKARKLHRNPAIKQVAVSRGNIMDMSPFETMSVTLIECSATIFANLSIFNPAIIRTMKDIDQSKVDIDLLTKIASPLPEQIKQFNEEAVIAQTRIGLLLKSIKEAAFSEKGQIEDIQDDMQAIHELFQETIGRYTGEINPIFLEALGHLETCKITGESNE